MHPPGSPEKCKNNSESHDRARKSVVEYIRSPSISSSMDRPSKSRGRQSSFKPLAQLRFKTLNELFPSRMHRKDTDDEPIIVEDDAGVERVIRNLSSENRGRSESDIVMRRNTLTSFDNSNLVPAGANARRQSKILDRSVMDNACVLHPHSRIRYNWDMTTLVMMAWVMIDVPFSVAFDIENPPNNGWNWHRVCGTLVDAFFMCDVILNFNTGVERANGSVSTHHWDIAKAYLKSWFWVDIISAFPLDLVMSGDAAQHNNVLKLSKASRVVRMFKLIRLLRIARVMRVVSRLEYTMSTQEAMRTLWKFFAVVVVTCHLFTCIFYMIGIETNGPDAWANGVRGGESNFDNYIAGFYWAVMTTTTIGYGDVSSSGTPQRIFGVFAMVVGALLFGYGVSNVVNIVEELRASERVFREKMDTFNQYMRTQNIPPSLQDAIREYLKNVKRCQDDRISVEEEIGLLSQLSLGLREEIAGATYERYLKDMPFFEGEDPMVVMEIAFSMERRYLGPGEDVITAGQMGNEMFFVLEGRVEVLVPLSQSGPKMLKRVAFMDKGQYFGEIALLEPEHMRSATIRTVCFCEFRCLSSTSFEVITNRYPHFRESMVETIENRKREHKSSGGSGLGTSAKGEPEEREFNALLQSASVGDEELGEAEKSEESGADGSRRPISSPVSTGGSLRSQPPDLPIIHETPTPRVSVPLGSNDASKILLKVHPWMHNNSGDLSKSTSDNPQEVFSESSTLETMLVTMSALVDENRLLREQVTDLSSEMRRMTAAQEDQHAAIAKLIAAVVPQSKFSGHNRSASGSKPGQLSPKSAQTNKPKSPPPVMRRAASMDRSTHSTPKFQRQSASSPKSKL